MIERQYTYGDCDYTNKKKLIVESAWNKDIENYVKNKKIDYLYFNHVKGWHGKDLNFLKNLQHVKHIGVLDHEIRDLSGINTLSDLELLSLITSSKTILDFKKFQNLKWLIFDWIKGSESLFECDSISFLSLYNSEEKNFKRISKLHKLKTLTLNEGKTESLDGIENLSDLSELRLLNLKQLSSINSISKLSNLKKLEIINGCKKFNNFDSVSKLTKLERLALDNLGEIESIKKLSTLKELKEISFHDSTNIMDGDLSVLEKLPKLHMVKFNNRKHYSHKRQDLDKSVDYELLKKEDARIRELIRKVKQEKAQKK